MNPTIWDILNMQQGGGFDEPQLADYLMGLLESSNYASHMIPGEQTGNLYSAISQDLSTMAEQGGSEWWQDFANMSPEELGAQGFLGFLSGNTGGEGGLWQLSQGEEFSSSSEPFEDAYLTILQGLQEGFKAVPTAESWGLSRKIGDVQKSGQRRMQSAREGYVPTEMATRYGTLQGKPGAKQRGEQLEQAYTSDIYGTQRGMGRDISKLYEDYEGDFFDSISSWLSNIGT